jgi:hypothetical protein
VAWDGVCACSLLQVTRRRALLHEHESRRRGQPEQGAGAVYSTAFVKKLARDVGVALPSASANASASASASASVQVPDGFVAMELQPHKGKQTR